MRLFYRLLSPVALILLCTFPCVAQPRHGLMRDAHTLVFNHMSITRTVEKLPDGVRTKTTTSDPELVQVLRKHPRQMGELYHAGGMVRGWDPLFRELATVGGKVSMKTADIEGGVEVVVTSEDSEVVKLIQAHADKVSEMARRGRDAMHEATPLPADYKRLAENKPVEEDQPGVAATPEVDTTPAVPAEAGAQTCATAGRSCCRRGTPCDSKR